jgi:hypothetical protein
MSLRGEFSTGDMGKFHPALTPREWWHPVLDKAVNKRILSTGETREFAGENVGFDLSPGG